MGVAWAGAASRVLRMTLRKRRKAKSVALPSLLAARNARAGAIAVSERV